MAHYLDNDTYTRLVDALLNVQPSAFTGTVTADEIKITLGEIGDLWPASIVGNSRSDW